MTNHNPAPFLSASEATPKCPECGVLLGPVPNCTHLWTATRNDGERLKAVSLHFDDTPWSFPALQAPDGALFVTDATYASLIERKAIDGHEGASDFARPRADALRSISGWEVNYDREEPSGPRDYMTSVDLLGDPLPAEVPMRCADCEAPVFYAGGYYHAVVPAPTDCWGVMSWISGAVDDPAHPLYAEWKATHDYCYDVAQVVCHECDRPLGLEARREIAVTWNDEDGAHAGTCYAHSACLPAVPA